LINLRLKGGEKYKIANINYCKFKYDYNIHHFLKIKVGTQELRRMRNNKDKNDEKEKQNSS